MLGKFVKFVKFEITIMMGFSVRHCPSKSAKMNQLRCF